MYQVVCHFTKAKLTIAIIYVKVYMYQLFQSLGYLHAQGVCHPYIKPQNMLVDPVTPVGKELQALATPDVAPVPAVPISLGNL